MGTTKFYLYTSLVLLLLCGYLSYNVIKPFITSIAWAVVLGIVFYPVYAFINRFVKWRVAASAMTVVVIVLVTAGPFVYLTILLRTEISKVLEYVDEKNVENIKDILANPAVAGIVEGVKHALKIEHVDLGAILMDNLTRTLKDYAKYLSQGIKNVLGMMVDFVVAIFTVFFLLKDAPGIILKIRGYLPFPEHQKDRLSNEIKDMVISTIYGSVIVAITQGLLGGVAFFLLGMESPALLGTAMTISSFIPVFGAATVWGAVDIYYFINGDYVRGVILLLFGVFGISMIDNVLKPIIISGRTKMPILIVLFSVIGGIQLFGLIGLIMGPLVIVMFFSLFEIFSSIEEGSNPDAEKS
jgi:predicted PurR-regulated permease PerM